MPLLVQAGSLARAGHGFTALVMVAAMVGCASTVPPSNVNSNAKLTPGTGITRDLALLPRPKAKIPVAVYGFRDQTGQFKTDSAYSTMVTQGAASMLVKALEDSGWYTPVEREGLQNLLTERRIIRALETPNDRAKPVINLPNMIPASLIIEGGVVAYESNVRTGGKGANFLGIGASTQYRVDQVTVSLRSVDVRNGKVLGTVSVTKTIYSHQFSSSVYKYVSYQQLLQLETGYARNEPAQLAVREAIEAAVVHLTVGGIRDRYFELADASTWFDPVIQAYLSETLADIEDEFQGEQRLVPMRPLSPDREPVQTAAFSLEEPARARQAAPAPVPSAAAPTAAATAVSTVPSPATAPSATAAVPPGSSVGGAPKPSPTPAPSAVPGVAALSAPSAAVAAPKPLPASAPTLAPAPMPTATATPAAPAAPSPAAAAKPVPQWGAPLPSANAAAPAPRPPSSPSPANSAAKAPSKPSAADSVKSTEPEDIFKLYWKGK